MSNVAAFLGGSFFGGIPNWVLLLLLAIFLFGGIFERWGVWLKEHGLNARANCNEKIASHRADELQDRMLVLEDRIGHRAAKLTKEIVPIVQKLDKSTEALAARAAVISDVNLEDTAERAFRAALPSMEKARDLTKLERSIALNTGQTMRAQLNEFRPALKAIETEGPRLREVAGKLGETERRFNQGVDQVNKAFTEFELIIKSEDRTKIAAGASIVIPWLIALLITGIALSGVFLNFFLIERPMAEIVGEGARIAGIGLPTFAAMIVIFLEFVCGIVLMDAAGFTRLIPAFHSMPDRARKVMFFVAFGFLAAFSALEMTLSIVREQIIERQQETRDLAIRALSAPPPPAAGADTAAAAEQPAPAENNPRDQGMALATVAQLILAALIPWLLAAAALPLETIVRNSVFMVSIVVSYLLLALAFIFRTIGAPSQSIAKLFPSSLDEGGKQRKERKKRKEDAAAAEDDIFTLTDENKSPKRERERDKRERELQRA
ncbi:MAG: hypothetical protein Q8R02_19450 [Hyphomonadaceae bacterium]|nr:hypothetical protein [Hyphomonadaceae bacterium]